MIKALQNNGIKFQALNEQFDSNYVPNLVIAVEHGAMVEHLLNRERIIKGLKPASARGRKSGRHCKSSKAA